MSYDAGGGEPVCCACKELACQGATAFKLYLFIKRLLVIDDRAGFTL